jgi:hypothetical protein
MVVSFMVVAPESVDFKRGFPAHKAAEGALPTVTLAKRIGDFATSQAAGNLACVAAVRFGVNFLDCIVLSKS